MNKINKQDKVKYDFDVHSRSSFYTFFINSYFDAIQRAIIKSNISFNKKIIVDIGIGRGRELPLLKSFGAQEVIGIDIDRKEIEYAEKKAKKFKIKFRKIVDTRDNKELSKIKNNSVDVVTLIYILNFIPEESTAALITHSRRILKPNGLLIVMPITWPSLMSFCKMIALTNLRFYTRSDWHKKLKPLKVTQEEADNYFYFPIVLMDGLGKIFGVKIYTFLNNLAKKIGIPPSSRVFICQKK